MCHLNFCNQFLTPKGGNGVFSILWNYYKLISWLLFFYRQEHQQLQERLKAIERKVIVGGVDLLKKAEEQEKLLEESNAELQQRQQQEAALRKQIENKEVILWLIRLLIFKTLPLNRNWLYSIILV